MIRIVSAVLVAFASCASTDRLAKNIELLEDTDACTAIVKNINWSHEIQVLNHISDLFRSHCYKSTIQYANEAKARMGFKTHSLSKETLEIFVYEGAITDYVLESYERGYLTFLITASYFQLGQKNSGVVELNKFYNEETALTYNHGQDQVNALVQAVMWDNYRHEGFSSRPFWQWLVNKEDGDTELRKFAARRIEQIDDHLEIPTWQLWSIGSFPNIRWSMNFIQSKTGYIELNPLTPFAETCRDDNRLLLPTKSWFHKIAMRHSKNYHPLVNFKSWMRLPVGFIYGAATLGAGAGIMGTSCAIDMGIKGDGHLCRTGIEMGAKVVGKSGDAVSYVLRPDIRHWEYLPAAIMIAPADQSMSVDCHGRNLGPSDFRIL